MRIFLAGATGAIGRVLLPLLLEEGHEVSAMTRDPDKAGSLKALGTRPVVCDVLDADAVRKPLTRAVPAVVIRPLTDPPARYRQAVWSGLRAACDVVA